MRDSERGMERATTRERASDRDGARNDDGLLWLVLSWRTEVVCLGAAHRRDLTNGFDHAVRCHTFRRRHSCFAVTSLERVDARVSTSSDETARIPT